MTDRNYEIPISPKYDGYQRGLAGMAFNYFDRKTGSGTSKSEKLAQNLHKSLIEKFKRKKVSARLKDNIWAADLAEMGSLFSKNRGFKYLWCVIDIFIKYAWVKPLENKNTKTVFHGFFEIVNECNRKPNKLWIHQGIEFYNNLMQIWLDNIGILIGSTHNESNSVVAWRWIRAFEG